MADADRTSLQQLTDMPSSLDRRGGVSQGSRHRISNQWLRDATLQQARAKSRATVDFAAITDGTTPSNLTTYNINHGLIEVLIDGVFGRIAAETDVQLIGGAPDVASYDLAGVAAAAIAVDDTDVSFALVAVLISGAVERRAVFGAEAATGTSVQPTAAQIKAALDAAAPAGLDSTVFLVLGRGVVARGTGAITGLTGVDPDTDDVLRSEQVIGSLGL